MSPDIPTGGADGGGDLAEEPGLSRIMIRTVFTSFVVPCSICHGAIYESAAFSFVKQRPGGTISL